MFQNLRAILQSKNDTKFENYTKIKNLQTISHKSCDTGHPHRTASKHILVGKAHGRYVMVVDLYHSKTGEVARLKAVPDAMISQNQNID